HQVDQRPAIDDVEQILGLVRAARLSTRTRSSRANTSDRRGVMPAVRHQLRSPPAETTAIVRGSRRARITPHTRRAQPPAPGASPTSWSWSRSSSSRRTPVEHAANDCEEVVFPDQLLDHAGHADRYRGDVPSLTGEAGDDDKGNRRVSSAETRQDLACGTI